MTLTQGKGRKDRAVLFPTSFRGELAQYLARQQAQGTPYLFESNRHRPYSTRVAGKSVRKYTLRRYSFFFKEIEAKSAEFSTPS